MPNFQESLCNVPAGFSQFDKVFNVNKCIANILFCRSDLLSELSWLESDIPKGVVVIPRYYMYLN